MAIDLNTQLALLSTRVYFRTDNNRGPVPSGWQEVRWLPDNAVTGFSAGVYRSTSDPNQIVIAFTGTNDHKVMDSVSANLPAATGLLPSLQVTQAIDLVRQTMKDNPGATITFTGHSLGGGLASLMAVFFDRPATIFAPAPFEASAVNPVTVAAYYTQYLASVAARGGSVDAAFTIYAAAPSLLFGAREAQVSEITVRGEFLSTWPGFAQLPTISGSRLLLEPGATSAGAVDLHSMSLHAAMLLSNDFKQAVAQTPALLPALFDARLYYRDPQFDRRRNLLDHLVRHEVGVPGSFPPSGLLTRFGQELLKLGGADGDAATKIDGLVGVLMQHYYDMTVGFTRELFEVIPSGLKFARPSGDGLGLDRLADAIQAASGAGDRLSVAGLARTSETFFVQWGSNALSVTGSAGNDAMMGGVGGDALDGAGGTDLIAGGAGDDQLTGSTGSDYLLGGDGVDTYTFAAGDGGDVVVDSDGQGRIVIDDVPLTGGKKAGDGYWISDPVNGVRYGLALVSKGDGSNDLRISKGSGPDSITIRNFVNGQLGITLDDALATVPASIIVGTAGMDWLGNGTLVNGAYVYTDLDARAGDDQLIVGGEGYVTGSAGSDVILSNLGDSNTIDGGADSDTIVLNGGTDRAYGGAGNDLIDGAMKWKIPNPKIVAMSFPLGVAGGYRDVEGSAGAQKIVLDTNGRLSYDYAPFVASSGTYAGYVFTSAVQSFALGGNQNPARAFQGEVRQGDSDPTGFGIDTITFLGLGSVTYTVASGPRTSEFGLFSYQVDSDPSRKEIFGEDGDDRLFGGAGGDLISGGADSDVLLGNGGGDELFGDAGTDFIAGGDDDDLVLGGAENDSLWGEFGNDQLFGESGNDYLEGDLEWSAADTALHGSDLLDGGSGDDVLIGGAKDDELYGGDGADQLVGDSTSPGLSSADYGDDYLDGETGADLLIGGGGADTLFGGGGDDQLIGDGRLDVVAAADHGADYLDGEDGDDSIAGNGGADTVYGGAGDDTLFGDGGGVPASANGDDLVDGGSGNDFLEGGGGSDVLFGGEGVDLIRGDANTDSVAALVHGADYIDGGAGGDELYGDGGNDIVLGGPGDDFLHGDDFEELLAVGAHGADTLDGGDGDDLILGGGGADSLIGGEGNDALLGGEGDDQIAGDNGADLLDGGAGDDRLQGGSGSDTYVIAQGYGNDVVLDVDGTPGNFDFIRVDGLTAQDFVLEREAGSSNLVLRIIDTDETITVLNHFAVSQQGSTEQAIEGILFQDGSQWNPQQLADATGEQVNGGSLDDTAAGSDGRDTVRGFDGSDILSGGGGSDLLDGGAGDDTLYGGVGNAEGGGNDVFVFGRGSGRDTIVEALNETDQDTIRLRGLLPQDVSFVADGADLVIAVEGTADRLRVQGYFVVGARTVETIRFANGVSFDKAAVMQRATAASLAGTDGRDMLIGSFFADRIDALGGDDVLDGGGGDDVLNGGSGDDTFIFRQGGGFDVIEDFTSNGAQTDLVHAPDWTADDVEIGRTSSGDLFMLSRNAPEAIVLRDFYADGRTSNDTAEAVRFADGSRTVQQLKTVAGASSVDTLLVGSQAADEIVGSPNSDLIAAFGGDDRLFGLGGNDTLRGGPGDDVLDGGAGNDVLDGDAGNDVLDGGGGSDTFVFGRGSGRDTIVNASNLQDGVVEFKDLAAADVSMQRDLETDDLLVRVNGSSDQLLIKGFFAGLLEDSPIDRFVLADGAQWDTAKIRTDFLGGTAASDTLKGYAGDDVIDGKEGDDIIAGRGGNDVLMGGDGNDRLLGNGGDDMLLGGAGDDILVGHSGSDILDGGPGNDVLDGVSWDEDNTIAGTDIYVFRRGGGQDTIWHAEAWYWGGARDDTLLLPDLNPDDVQFERDPGNREDLLVKLVNSTDQVRLAGFFSNTVDPYLNRVDHLHITRVEFADGTVLSVEEIVQRTLQSTDGDDILRGYYTDDTINGGAGNDDLDGEGGDDILSGGSGDDTIQGGGGNDTIDGGPGNDVLLDTSSDWRESSSDTYIYRRGDGNDIIFDRDATEGFVDRLRFEDLNVDDLSLERQSNGDLKMSVRGSGETITIRSFFSEGTLWDGTPSGLREFIIERFEFADGTYWGRAEIEAAADLPPPEVGVPIDTVGATEHPSPRARRQALAKKTMSYGTFS